MYKWPSFGRCLSGHIRKQTACFIIITTNAKLCINMKTFRHTLFFFAVVSILVLASSGCQKEKITRWRCVPYEGCLIEISVDNETDYVYVSADYRDFVPPDSSLYYYYLFYDNTILKKTGEVLRYIDRTTHRPYYPIFLITSQSEETMDISAISYLEGGNCYSHCVTDYHFIRIP